MALTPKFRVSYPNVFKPRLNDLNGKQEFSLVALFDKPEKMSPADKKAWDTMKAEAEACAVKKWGADKTKWPKGLKTPFRDQAEREKDGKLPNGYVAGNTFITLRSTERPGLVDQNKQEIIEPSAFYSGCYARALVNFFAYDQKGNRGISCSLQHLQKMGEGDVLSGRPKVEDAFEAIGDEGTDATSIFS